MRWAVASAAFIVASSAFAQQSEPMIAPGVVVPRPPGSIPAGPQPLAAIPPAILAPAPAPSASAAAPAVGALQAPLVAPRSPFASMRDALRAGVRGYNSGDMPGAVKALSYAADQGHPGALWKLGKMFASGDGVPQDPLKAFEYFSRIADEHADEPADSPNARFISNAFVSLGAYYLDGIPKTYVKADPERAREMFYYAASYFGDPDAQYNLARMLIDGNGGPKDSKQAARWLNLAADKGHPAAQAMLGNLLINGADGVPRQTARGLGLLQMAREAADPARDAWIIELHGHAFAATSEQDHDAARAFVERRLKRR
ncbi:tetratricopeptide repeat protein [Terrarubrum flagellatum]|uniref:tetratricopeptide repeat protein n=1 Tax=Terrirubrum flagellatum TaxID=2895980 RepID=UPI0031450581